MLTLGEFHMMEQALEFLGMDSYDANPTRQGFELPENLPHLSKEQKIAIADKILLAILNHYQYAQFDINNPVHCEINPPQNVVQLVPTVVGQTSDRHLLIMNKTMPLAPDDVMSHSQQLCAWTIHLMHLNDMAKEGDLARTVLACKMNVPFFFSHSKLSKYFVECIDYDHKPSCAFLKAAM